MRKYKILKDKKTRERAKKAEFKSILYKYQINSLLNSKIKLIVHKKFLQNFHLNSSSSRIVNTCVKSGRSRWILRRFRLARMTFKIMADNGEIYGVRRSSW